MSANTILKIEVNSFYLLSMDLNFQNIIAFKARFFYQLIYRIFFFRFRVRGREKNSENDQMTGHFQSFFSLFSFFRAFFFNISITNSKTCKVNQQSVLNL